MNWQTLLPWVLLGGAAAAAAWIDSVARRRDPREDSGSLWARVLKWSGCLWCALWLSIVAESITPFWRTGWHLQFDRALAAIWTYPVAILIPFGLWIVLATYALQQPAPRQEDARWLAGAIN